MTKEKYIDDYDQLLTVFGEHDSTMRKITDAFNVNVFAGSSALKITGEEEAVNKTIAAIESLIALSEKEQLRPLQIDTVIDMVNSGNAADINELLGTVALNAKGRAIRAKSLGQKQYVDAIKRSEIVFGIGPAGTGKTYLAVAMAVYALKNHECDKIILTRPAVEAGEKLGFLPGDLSEKVDPYLRPLFDALQEMLGENYPRYIERGSVEIAPLAYMRGRTLTNSFIILDEAQNTTREQMKMFLTRIGENSRMVVTGDVTQIDLPYNVESGLCNARDILKGVKGIEIIELDHRDVVRHELVSRIIKAYAQSGERERQDYKKRITTSPDTDINGNEKNKKTESDENTN